LDNTATAAGPGSVANAGTTGNSQSGYTATAGPGQTVTNP
jgi:hypothetical protein